MVQTAGATGAPVGVQPDGYSFSVMGHQEHPDFWDSRTFRIGFCQTEMEWLVLLSPSKAPPPTPGRTTRAGSRSPVRSQDGWASGRTLGVPPLCCPYTCSRPRTFLWALCLGARRLSQLELSVVTGLWLSHLDHEGSHSIHFRSSFPGRGLASPVPEPRPWGLCPPPSSQPGAYPLGVQASGPCEPAQSSI